MAYLGPGTSFYIRPIDHEGSLDVKLIDDRLPLLGGFITAHIQCTYTVHHEYTVHMSTVW